MFHFSTLVLNPQPHTLFSPLPIFPSAPTPRKLQSLPSLRLPTKWNLHSLPLSYDDSDEPVIGDCLVFEEGIFEDPIFHHPNNDNSSATLRAKKPKSKKKMAVVAAENLVPEKWREVQAEINITKKERRKIAQEIEFNSKVDKKKRGLIPLRDMDLNEYKAYKEAKLAQLKPFVLDNPTSFPVKKEESEPKLNDGSVGGGERVMPRNPRWAVYGRGLEDVTEFFNSENYDPDATAKTSTDGIVFSFLFFKLSHGL